MGSFTPDPPVTNIGYTKSEGSNRVSASNDRTAALLRFRRSLAKFPDCPCSFVVLAFKVIDKRPYQAVHCLPFRHHVNPYTHIARRCGRNRSDASYDRAIDRLDVAAQ